MRLLRYNRPVATIFDLLGSKEDDMTYSLGYVMSRSPAFAALLLKQVTGTRPKGLGEGSVRLQTPDPKGRTDVELIVANSVHAIFEAKRGAQLPRPDQLRRYLPRLTASTATTKRLVTVSNTPDAHADLVASHKLGTVPVVHLSWRTIRNTAQAARTSESHRNKRLLDEFTQYLEGILGMERRSSNMVYVVSISNDHAWGVGFRPCVENHKRYFYPVGKNWPDEPPNYIAFRWDARLQSIHHVEGYEIFTDPASIFPEAKPQTIEPHYCLRLGPPIRPAKPVPNGPKISRAMRVWCMIDTLLTAKSITDAHAQTKARLGGGA